MSDRDPMHPDEERAAAGVRGLPNVEADAAFRERLRSAFVTGEIDKASAGVAQPAPRRRNRWLPWMVPALVAAVVAALIMTRPPALRVIAVSGGGEARVNGAAVPLADRDELGRSIHSGVTLELPDSGSMDLLSDGIVLIEVTPGTRVTIPTPPGRLFQRAAVCTLTVGEIRIKTGARFHGSTLRVYTPEGLAEVTGTMLSVQCDAGGTCVCVVEGTVHVGVDRADLKPVEAGYRRVMLRDGTKEIIPIKEMHRDGVIDFNLRVGDRIQNP